jgi:hypothetical protein
MTVTAAIAPARPLKLGLRRYRLPSLYWYAQMPRKMHTPEEIVAKLRPADVLLPPGRAAAEVIRSIGATSFTCFRWRKEFGGLKSDQVKRQTSSTRIGPNAARPAPISAIGACNGRRPSGRRGPGNFVETVASALRRARRNDGPGVEPVTIWTGASEKTVKHRFAGRDETRVFRGWQRCST